MKVKIASIGLNAEKDKKGAERKRIEAKSGKILDGCLVINIFVKSDGSLQIKQEKKSEIWFSEINKRFIIFEKESDDFYEKNIYIEFFKGLGEIYYKYGNREKTKFSFGIRGIYERNPVTFQIQKLILDYCAKKDRFYSEIKKEINEFLADEANIENIFKNYHITLFDKEICSRNEYFRLLLEKEKKEMKGTNISYNSDSLKSVHLLFLLKRAKFIIFCHHQQMATKKSLII